MSTKVKTQQQQQKPIKSYYKKKEIFWGAEEDAKLMELVRQHGSPKWRVISKYMQKSMIKCHTRYLQLTEQSDQANSRWTKEQDEILLDFVKKNGEQNWGQAAALIPGRIAKQCRERWLYQLNPNIKKNKWTVEEDVKVVKLYL